MTKSYSLSFSVLAVGLGLASAMFTACGDKTALRPQGGSGGGSAIVVPGTGGDLQGTEPSSVGGNTGQSVTGTGGDVSGTGGVGTGGSIFGTGGVGTGGAIFGTGGVGMGGVSLGTGGVAVGTGGTSMGAGGASLSAGGAGGGVTLASGGTGGGIIGGCRYPSCLWNLVKDCLVTGQCTEDDSPSTGIQSQLCCNNGVTETVSVLTQTSGSMSGTVTVTKGGQACYTVTFNGRMTSGGDWSATYAWMDPSGQVAVKGVMSNPDFVTLNCPNGETGQFDVDCSPDGSDEAIKTPGNCE